MLYMLLQQVLNAIDQVNQCATNEKGEGVYQSIIQRPSEASALINYLVSRLQENSTLTSPHYINTKAIVSID